jgi:hypothetical protein
VSILEGTFPKKEGMNPKKKYSVSFGPSYFSAVGGCTVRICIFCTFRTDLARKLRHFGHSFRAGFKYFGGCLWVVLNSL